MRYIVVMYAEMAIETRKRIVACEELVETCTETPVRSSCARIVRAISNVANRSAL